jgi:hypothetical protein
MALRLDSIDSSSISFTAVLVKLEDVKNLVNTNYLCYQEHNLQCTSHSHTCSLLLSVYAFQLFAWVTLSVTFFFYEEVC